MTDNFYTGFGYGGLYGGGYILVLIGALLCLITSGLVKSTFKKYSKVAAASGITGCQVAQEILHRDGISDVKVQCALTVASAALYCASTSSRFCALTTPLSYRRCTRS